MNRLAKAFETIRREFDREVVQHRTNGSQQQYGKQIASDLWGVADAAGMLKISRWTLYRLIRSGKVVAYSTPWGSCIRVRPSDVLSAYQPARKRAK